MEYIGYAVNVYKTLMQIIDFLKKESKIYMKREVYTSEKIVFKSYDTTFKKTTNNTLNVRNPPNYCIWSCLPEGVEAKKDKFEDINKFETVEFVFKDAPGEIRSSIYTHLKQDKEVYQKELFDDVVENLFKTYKDRCKIKLEKYLAHEEKFYPKFPETDPYIIERYYKLVYTLTKNRSRSTNENNLSHSGSNFGPVNGSIGALPKTSFNKNHLDILNTVTTTTFPTWNNSFEYPKINSSIENYLKNKNQISTSTTYTIPKYSKYDLGNISSDSSSSSDSESDSDYFRKHVKDKITKSSFDYFSKDYLKKPF